MCTISWLPAPDGYRVWMNRDEARTRPRARAPRVLRLPAGPAVAPRDPRGGGSWIGTTAAGMTLALANAYPAPAPPAPKAPVSRGLLLMEALERAGGAAVRRWMGAKDLSPYPPFSISVFEPGAPAATLGWDGRRVSERRTDEAGLVATSSSWRPAEVARTRAAVFRMWAQEHGGFSSAALDRLHASREPAPGPHAVSMERRDACTASLSVVEVSASTVRFWYVDGPPHCTAAGPPGSLPRRRAAADGPTATMRASRRPVLVGRR